MMNGTRGPGGRRTGTAMIEAAVVLPILLLLLFGIMEVGRVLMAYSLLTSYVRIGARLAVVTPDLKQNDPRVVNVNDSKTAVGRIRERLDALVNAGGLAAFSGLQVAFVGDPPGAGDPQRGLMLRVGAEVDFVPAVLMVFNKTIPLQAQVVARHE